MTKSELDNFLKNNGYNYDIESQIYQYNNKEYTIIVSGEHVITITILNFNNAVNHFILLKNLTEEKFDKILKILMDKMTEINEIFNKLLL